MTKKIFASFEQQIQHLEDKGIIISDRAYAEAMLKQIGYFPLIGGYKHLFRIPFTKTYKIGTTFEEIVALYEFDSDLRDLFFKYLLQIERTSVRLCPIILQKSMENHRTPIWIVQTIIRTDAIKK